MVGTLPTKVRLAIIAGVVGHAEVSIRGETETVLAGHADGVKAVCAVEGAAFERDYAGNALEWGDRAVLAVLNVAVGGGHLLKVMISLLPDTL